MYFSSFEETKLREVKPPEVIKPDAECKVKCPDCIGYLKRSTYPGSSLSLIGHKYGLDPAERRKSRPACIGDRVIDYIHSEKSSCSGRTSEKPVPNLGCLRFGWSCQRIADGHLQKNVSRDHLTIRSFPKKPKR